MAIQKEIWVDYIIQNLFKDNSFMEMSFNADQFVVGGKIVHIPRAGAKPNVEKNRAQLPAVVVQRADSDIVYAIDEFTTDPTLIPNADTVELSYDKIDSVMSEHMEALREALAEHLLRNWASSTNPTATAHIVRTTGGTGGTTAAATAPGATGNRKIIVKEDLKKAQTYMNKQSIPKSDRYALFPSDLLDQLQSDADLIKRDFGKELDMKNGVIDRLFGFQIMERSSVLAYDSSAAVKAVGAASAVTDHDAVLCWQKNSVERAKGTIDFFENIADAQYYGDVYSALVRMGGRIRRPEGVVAIVQNT